MTCPAIIPGSVSSTGTLNGFDSATLVDVYGDRQGVEGTQGVNSQFQYPIFLSDKSSPVDPTTGTWQDATHSAAYHYQHNQEVKGEHVLLLALVAGRGDSAVVPWPQTGVARTVGSNWTETDAQNAVTTYTWQVTYIVKSATNCHHTEKAASGGAVTLSFIDATRVEASYSALTFGGVTGQVSGSFVAPRAGVAGSMDYSDCPTRPSQTCISG